MMFVWLILPILFVILIGIYICKKIYSAVNCFAKKLSKRARVIVTSIVSIILILPAINIYGIWFIVLLHLTVFLVLLDIVAVIIKKIHYNKNSLLFTKIYRSGIIAIVITAMIMGYGYYNIYNVEKTEYTILSEKNIRKEGYKLVFISDLHYGITLDKEQLQKEAEVIEKENPDFVILGGDIVDENTTLTQMQDVFSILGNISSKYGTYYVYGNHDKNVYSLKPNYSAKQLEDTINKSGIHILEDTVLNVNDDIVFIGRADKGDGESDRKSISNLVQGLNHNKEWILIDHQPSDYTQADKNGVGLILSGHTHAGQIWPAGLISSALNLGELNYGYKKQGNLNAIVSSGIAGWGYPIRTEKHSEYVVVNIKNN